MVLALGFALAATASAFCFWLYGNWYINMAWIFLGLTSEELLKKMSALRTYYGKEIGKERSSRTSGKGTKDVYVSKWHFFTSLHFLRDNITPRKTSSNMDTCISEEKENEAVGQDQPSQQATHHVSDDGSDQGSVFPTNNPPSVKNKKKEGISIWGWASFHLFRGNEVPERGCHWCWYCVWAVCLKTTEKNTRRVC